jgi:L-lactate dehydrogenase complex protein LldG
MSARDAILKRIRAANGRSGAPTAQEREAVMSRLRTHPRGPLPTMDTIDTRSQLPQAVARYLREHDLQLQGACWPEYAGLDWAGAGLAFEPRPSTGSDKVGVTGTFCAIAENGTLMLLSGADTHATTSLLPETHIAVVSASRVVHAMEDAWDLMRREHGSLPRQVNFVSGPSRTADIEMTLVMGVHGPFRVHVVVVND